MVSSWNGYYKSLTSFLEETPAPVITLEALPHLDRTIAAYAALGQAGDRFLLPTPYNNPRPFVGWKSLAHIIQQFVPKEVAVCGSLLEVRGDTYSACVGVAYTRLRNYFPQIKLERTLCNDLAVELEHRHRDSELNDLC